MRTLDMLARVLVERVSDLAYIRLTGRVVHVLKVVTVCGAGQGTSLLLRMHTEDVLRELGVRAQVEASDVTSAVGATADLLLASPLLMGNLASARAPVFAITDYLDKNEIKAVLQQFLSHGHGETSPNRINHQKRR